MVDVSRCCAPRHMGRVCWVALVYLSFAIPKCVFAQALDRFEPALGDEGFLGLDGTRTPGSLRGSAHLFTDLALDPIAWQTPAGSRLSIRQRFMLHLGGELGIGGRAALAVRLPLIAYQRGVASGRHSHDVFALVDPQLWARYRFLGASMSDPYAPHDGPGLALQVGLGLPLGKRQHDPPDSAGQQLAVGDYPFASDAAVSAQAALLADFQLFGAGIGGSLGVRHHFWDPKGVAAAATRADDELTFGAALKVPIPPVPALSSVLELRGASGFRSSRDTSLELDLAARLAVGDFVIVLGGGLGLTRGLGTPDGRVLLGVYGVLAETDSDHDGVDDSRDQCVFLPEDRDGFQDEDGCPDPDNDNDLVPDLDDKCPNQQAEEGRDEDEDGCTDPAPKPAQ